MAKKGVFSLSRFLYEVGSRIQYRSDPIGSSFARDPEEKKIFKFSDSLLPHKKKVKSTLSRSVEQSVLLSLKRKAVAYLFSTRIRSFGVLFFSCGFLQILCYFLSHTVSFLPTGEDRLVFGVAQIFLTLLASFSRGDLSDGVKKSFLFCAFLSPLCGLRETDIPSAKSHDAVGVMLLAGIALGIVGAYFSPVFLLQIILLVAFLLLVFAFPETGLLISLFCALFLPKSFLVFVSISTLLSYLCKCAVGKRSLMFSPLDLPVLFFLLPFVFIGENAGFLMFLSMFSLYALCSALVRNTDGIHRVFSAITVFSFFGALVLISGWLFELFVPALALRYPRIGLIFFIKPGAETGLLFAMTAPLILADMKSAQTFGKKLWCLVSFGMTMVSLVPVGNPAVWLSAVLGILLFLLFTYRSALILILGSGLLLITLLHILPSEYILMLMRGLGRGDSVGHGAVHQSFLGFLLQKGGLFWCGVFLFVLGWLVFEVLRFSGAAFPRVHPKLFGVLSSAAVLFAISVQDMMPDFRVLCLFVFLAAIPRAALRSAGREAVRLPY